MGSSSAFAADETGTSPSTLLNAHGQNQTCRPTIYPNEVTLPTVNAPLRAHYRHECGRHANVKAAVITCLGLPPWCDARALPAQWTGTYLSGTFRGEAMDAGSSGLRTFPAVTAQGGDRT